MPGSRSAQRIRVVLVEDESLYRDILRVALSQTGRVEVVGHFADGEAVLAEAPELRPQVAILDIRLRRGPNGIQVGRLLRQKQPELGIVLLSNHEDPSFLAAVPKGEVAGWSYLLKSSVNDLETLVRAVEGAASGLVVLDPQLVRRSRTHPSGELPRLTPRQQEILSLMAQGFSNSGIAGQLQVSLKTVANQINVLYEALGIDRSDGSLQPRVQAVLAYLRDLRPV